MASLETIAKVKAKCYDKLDTGKCKKEDCANCSRFKNLSVCYNRLDAGDKLYVDARAESFYNCTIKAPREAREAVNSYYDERAAYWEKRNNEDMWIQIGLSLFFGIPLIILALL